MSEKPVPTTAPLHDLIARRWSPRAFDASRPVPRDELMTLLEAARWAPSCFNDQPWRLVVCDRTIDEPAWQRLLQALAEKNQRWARNAPVLILACADSEFDHNGKPNRWGQYDTGAAMMALVFQATAMGLATHQMGGFDVEAARQAVGVPPRYQPMAVMALGYSGDISGLEEGFRAAEAAPRQRAEMSRRFYLGSWGNPVGGD